MKFIIPMNKKNNHIPVGRMGGLPVTGGPGWHRTKDDERP